MEQTRRHVILRPGGIDGKQSSCLAIIPHKRMSEAHEFLISVGEVHLVVIGPGNQDRSARRALLLEQGLRLLAGPTALWALHSGVNPTQQLAEWNLERNRPVDTHPPLTQPTIQKLGLRHAAWESIENPSCVLTNEPFGDDAAHQIIRKILAPFQDGLGKSTQIRLVFNLLAEQCTGAQVTELQNFRQPPALRALTRCRRPEQDDAKLAGARERQWIWL